MHGDIKRGGNSSPRPPVWVVTRTGGQAKSAAGCDHRLIATTADLPGRCSKESSMKQSRLLALAMGLLSLALWANFAHAAADKAEAAKTITGKSECATCSGVTAAGHNVMLVDKDGTRWVLIGDSESYKKAHEVRKAGKAMTATLAGEPTTKKDATGKEYKEVKVSEIKIG